MTALHVTFRVGNADYAIAATDVLHLEAFSEATHVPGAPSYVAGLVHTRGRVIPVVDLRSRFGLPSAGERSLDSRVVVVRAGARVVGMLVDSAREVVQLDETTFENPPEIIAQQSHGFVKAIAPGAKRMFLIVDIPRVIGEELSHG